MHSFIEFFFHHLKSIIVILSIVCVGLGGIYIIFKAYFEKPEKGAVGNLEGIEDLLRKVIDQADNIGPQKAKSFQSKAGANAESDEEASGDGGTVEGSSAGNSGESSIDSGELKKLQEQLVSKQAEIEKLSSELKDKSSGSGENSKDLLEKINELEARLAEYEIIEDDIADLSKYKDENARLKEEIEKLKVGGATESSDLPSDDEIESDEATDGDTEASSVVEEEVEVEEEKITDTAPEEVGDDPITDDLISEFEQAVNEQLGAMAKPEEGAGEPLASAVGDEIEVSEPSSEVEEDEEVDSQAAVDSLFEQAASELASPESDSEPTDGPPEPTGEPDMEPIASKPNPAPIVEDNSEGADDIFGEFVPEEETVSIAAKPVDTDKMLEEMSSLAEVDSSDVESSLDQELDVEKMANEAQTLEEKG